MQKELPVTNYYHYLILKYSLRKLGLKYVRCEMCVSICLLKCVYVYVRVLMCFILLLQGAGQDRLGIYIKSVVKGGAADAVSLILLCLICVLMVIV